MLCPQDLLQLAFEDALEAFCYAVLPLNLMSVPEPLILTWAGIKRAMLLDFPLALIHLRRADVELGVAGALASANRNTENVRVIKSRPGANRLLQHISAPAPPQ